MVLLDVQEVSLERIEELVKYTHKRVEMAEKVLKDPSDDNLRDYNYIVEIHGEMRRDLCIYPKLTEAEIAASAIWKARKDDIDW